MNVLSWLPWRSARSLQGEEEQQKENLIGTRQQEGSSITLYPTPSHWQYILSINPYLAPPAFPYPLTDQTCHGTATTPQLLPHAIKPPSTPLPSWYSLGTGIGIEEHEERIYLINQELAKYYSPQAVRLFWFNMCILPCPFFPMFFYRSPQPLTSVADWTWFALYMLAFLILFGFALYQQNLRNHSVRKIETQLLAYASKWTNSKVEYAFEFQPWTLAPLSLAIRNRPMHMHSKHTLFDEREGGGFMRDGNGLFVVQVPSDESH